MIIHDIRFPETVSAYMNSDSRTRHVMGPWRSGKSVGSIVEIVRRAMRQHRGPDGKRKSKWMVVRNTVRDLADTTIATWNQWFPSGTIGYWHETTKTYRIRVDDVEADVMFRALDRPEHVANLLSLEITGAYFNEVRQIERVILEGVDGRIGHYPSKAEGGCTWAGIWADTNPPEEGSYLECMYEGKDPDDRQELKTNSWAVFKQPPAVLKNPLTGKWEVNPHAENKGNLNDPLYYEQAMKDKSEEYIRVNLGCEYGRSKGGRPVHSLFNSRFHVAAERLKPDPMSLLVIAADFGGTPALTLKQQNALGQVVTLDEIVTFNSNIKSVIEDKLLPLIRNKYDGYEMFVTGDPSGDSPSQTNGENCTDIFRHYSRKGLGKVKFAYSNVPVLRQSATDHFLQKIIPGEPIRPQFLVDPSCQWYIEGLAGKYFFKRHKDGRHLTEVEKNDWSHVCFVAGTPIATPAGSVPVEALGCGDVVRTPAGNRRIVAAMARPAMVREFTFGDKRVTCTLDHPFFTQRGFVAADALQYTDLIAVEILPWKILFMLHRFERAKLRPDGIHGLMTRTALALCAAARFALIATQKLKPVRLSAQGASYQSRVYNIEVADTHAYYANGLLVSNCEAGEYADMYFEKGGRRKAEQSGNEVAIAAARRHNNHYNQPR